MTDTQTPTETPTAAAPDQAAESKTFTQADVNKVVEDRLNRERSKFGDYDQLKAAAAELETLKSSQQTDQEKTVRRAEKAEGEVASVSAERDALKSRTERLEVVLTHALGEDEARRLTKAADRLLGDSRQDWETDVADLGLPVYAQDGKRPGGDAGQGPRPTPPTPADTSPKGLIMAGLEENERNRR
jgi:hypothetical protein